MINLFSCPDHALYVGKILLDNFNKSIKENLIQTHSYQGLSLNSPLALFQGANE